jgi:hypothetical protein
MQVQQYAELLMDASATHCRRGETTYHTVTKQVCVVSGPSKGPGFKILFMTGEATLTFPYKISPRHVMRSLEKIHQELGLLRHCGAVAQTAEAIILAVHVAIFPSTLTRYRMLQLAT